jgi:hypothetical protein
MRRALMRTSPASLRSFSRIVPQVASVNWVRKADAPERAEENIGKRGEPEPLWLSYDEPWFTSHGQRAVGPPARHAWGR